MTKSDRLVDAYMGLRRQIAQLVSSIVPPKEVEDIEARKGSTRYTTRPWWCIVGMAEIGL